MSDDFLDKRRIRYESNASALSGAASTTLHESAYIFNVKEEIVHDYSKVNFYKPSGTSIGAKSETNRFRFYNGDDSSESGDSELSWPSTEIPDAWGANPLSTTPWNDEDKPVASFKTFRIEYIEEEREGILTDRILALASSYLDRCPVTGNYVLCKCNLQKQKLTDITIMGYHYYLQYVNLSHNELEDIEALGQLPFLMYLDISHNRMSEVLQFKPPFNLTYVDYSYNDVVMVRDLSEFWSIVYLDLSYNRIKNITGIDNLKYLRHLNLEHNAIERLENLNHMNLLTLKLNDNCISSFEEGDDVGLKTLTSLLKLHISNNELKSLKLFENVNTLQTITFVANLISDISELYHLKSLLSLTELDLRQNSLSSQPHYHDFCIFNLPSLLFLDGDFVDPQSKVQAFAKLRMLGNIFSPMKLTSILTLINQLNYPNISPFDLRIDEQPPKMLIFVGPPASNKGTFIRQLWNLKKQHLQIGVSHTTRLMCAGEEDGLTYHYVSQNEFIRLVNNGEMLTYKKYLGEYFGLTRRELYKVSGKKKILVFHCDLENAIHLKTIGLRPYLILTLPADLDVHKKWIAEKYFIHKLDKEIMAAKIVRGRHFEREDEVYSDEYLDYDYNYQARRDSSAESVSSESASTLFTTYVDEIDLNLLEETKYSRYQQRKLSTTSNDFVPMTQEIKDRYVAKEKTPTVSFGAVLEVDEASVLSATSATSSSAHYSATMLDDDVFIPYEDFNAEKLSSFNYSIIRYRVEYIKYVNDNTGFFLNSIFTDEHAKSIKKALRISKDIFLEQVPNSARYNVKDDPCYEEFVGQRLKTFKDEMTKYTRVQNHVTTKSNKKTLKRD